MKKTLLSFLALGAIASVALAEESTITALKPVKLTEPQMDNINAGFHIAGINHVGKNYAINHHVQLWKYIIGECTSGVCPTMSLHFSPSYPTNQ